MKIALIDNYDSFTYNLVHLVRSLGTDVDVIKNDRFRLSDLVAYDKILLSPGPGLPSEAGLLLDVIKEYAGKKPILGVCLGHQAIAETFGARLKNLKNVILHHAGRQPTICCSAVCQRNSRWAATTVGWSSKRICRLVLRSLP